MKPLTIGSNAKLYLISMFSIVLLSSCSVDSQHHVRTGEDPRYQDKDVAFRTTHYFRVFDYCYNEHQKQSRQYPKTSGLYRFKMTGKSNTHNNIVKFESGALKSWELDPLGATVIYDKNIGRHRFVSEDETQNQATKEQAWQTYERLKTEYLQLSKTNSDANITDVNNALTALLTASISNASVIDLSATTGLPKQLETAFNTQKTNLDSINSKVQTAVIDAIKAKQIELLQSNVNSTQLVLNDISRVWLIETIKTSLSRAIESEVKSLNDASINPAKDKTHWQALISKLASSVSFPLANATIQATYIEKLSEKYRGNNQLSEIDSLKITHNGKTVLASNVLAQHYIEELNKQKVVLKLTVTDFDSVYDAQLARLKKNDGKYRTLTTEDKAYLTELLIINTHSLFNHTTALNDKVSNVPRAFDFTVEAATKNIYANLNKTNLAKALSAQSNAIIQSAVQGIYYESSGSLSTTIATLRKAMDAKLATATGTSVSSDAESLGGSSQNDEEILCNQVNKRTGFQILGPEGWRTFNQDERLVMAMYSDNSPITGVLKELSKQVLDAHQSDEPSLLPLVQAELRLTEVMQELLNNKANVATADTKEKKQLLCKLVKKANTKLGKTDPNTLNALINDEDC